MGEATRDCDGSGRVLIGGEALGWYVNCEGCENCGGPSWWSFSFADPDLPEGTQFLGGCFVQAKDEAGALTVTHLTGVNPGGEALMIRLPKEVKIPGNWAYRLLSKEELERMPDPTQDWCSMCYGTGWVLEAKRPVSGEQAVEMMPCLKPDCPVSGMPIYNLSFVDARFQHASFHPKERWVMSLSHPSGTPALK